MRQEDIDWSVTTEYTTIPSKDSVNREVEINGITYLVNENTACLAHSIMLLVDSLNDKSFK